MSLNDYNSEAGRARQLAAAEWVIRLHNSHADEETAEQWLSWCHARPENLEAFENIRSLWIAFEHPTVKDALISDLRAGATTARGPPAAAGLGQRLNGALGLALQFFERNRRGASVLAFAAAMTAIGFGVLHKIGSRTEFTQTISTAVASLSRQTLPDGSVVELGAKSKVRVRMSHSRRDIFVDDGEAFFRVAKDSTRPFVVRAGHIDVVALGTEFTVRKAQDDVVVTVEEGAVRVAPEASSTLAIVHENDASAHSGSSGVRADAGRRVSYSSRKRSMTVTDFQAPAPSPSDWAVGHLHFVNEPLASVITDVNRYSSRHISLRDGDLGMLTFTGTLRRDAIDDWLQGVREVFPIDVLDDGDDGIVLSRRQ